ncbi:MAG: aspartate aminotransferase family protein [Bacteroidota bacterium]
MVNNKQLFLRHVAQTSDFPVFLEVEHAEGIFMYDPTGKPYIDLISGVSVSNLGHRHPAVLKALKEQADAYMHLMVYGEFVESPQVRYAAWLADNLPASLDNVYFVSSGSEAIEGAMKLVKRVTGRPNFVAFRNAYHGSSQGALSLIGDPLYQGGFLPLLPGIRHIDFNDPKQLAAIDRQTAAVFVEPIQGEAGIIEPAGGFLTKLAERCWETGTLLVADEIQTGFGRTGKLFAFEHYGIVPDILCVSKSFGGGMPLGAFISSKENMSKLTFDPPLGHITTFGGHPVCCAAGLAAQSYMLDNGLIGHAAQMGQLYRDLLQHKAIAEIRGKGLYLAVRLDGAYPVALFLKKAFEKGIAMDMFLFCQDAFRISPPLIISQEEVELSVKWILEVLDDMAK